MSNETFSQEVRQSLHELVEALRKERDQLSLQANLGKMELRDEWHAVENKWRTFESKVEGANDDAKQSLHELGKEIAETYGRLKKKLD